MTWQELMAAVPHDCELTIRLGARTAPTPNAITLRLREVDEFGGRSEMFITGEALDSSAVDGVGLIGLVLEDMKRVVAGNAIHSQICDA